MDVRDGNINSQDVYNTNDPLGSVVIYDYCLDLTDSDKMSVTHLFSLTKKNIMIIRQSLKTYDHQSSYYYGSKGSKAKRSQDELDSMVSDVMEFISIIGTCFTRDNCTKISQDMLIHMLDQMKLLLIYTNRLSVISDQVIQESMRNHDSIEYSYIKLLLHIWSCGAVMFHMAKSHAGLSPTEPQILSESHQSSMCSSFHIQVLQLFISDLMSVSIMRFKKFPKNGDIEVLKPFPDVIFDQSLLNVKSFLDRQESVACDVSFWQIFNSITESYSNHNDTPDDHLRCFNLFPKSIQDMPTSDSMDVTILWLMVSYAKVLKSESCDGTVSKFNNQQQQHSMMTCVVNIIQKLVKKDEMTSSDISSSSLISLRLIRMLIQLNILINVDLIFPYFELIIKRLNSNDGYPDHLIPKTGHEWFIRVTDLRQVTSSSDIFSLFISLLDTMISKLVVSDATSQKVPTGGNMSQYRRLKGRLYTKIQPKRLDDLNDVAYYKFITIFLHFVNHHNDWSEINDKICDVFNKITSTSDKLSQSKVATGIKSLFTSLYLRQETSAFDPKKTVLLLTSVFKKIIQELISPDVMMGSVKYMNLTSNLLVYFDEVKSLFRVKLNNSRRSSLNESTQDPLNTTQTRDEMMCYEMFSSDLRQIIFLLLEQLMYSNDDVTSKIQDVLKIIIDDIKTDSHESIREIMVNSSEDFIQRYLGHAPNIKVFKSIEVLIQDVPELTYGTETIFGSINRVIRQLETQRRIGTDADMRRYLNELLRKFSR